MNIILLIIWYLFMYSLSFWGMVKLDIGVDHYVYSSDDYFGPFFGSIVWPLTWLMIGLFKISKKIVDKIVVEITDDKESKEGE